MENKPYDITEYLSPEGEIIILLCKDHVNVQMFIESCNHHFSVIPVNVNHVYFSEKREGIGKDEFGKMRYKTTFQKSKKGSPMTIGYL